jgi:hypothetical protein
MDQSKYRLRDSDCNRQRLQICQARRFKSPVGLPKQDTSKEDFLVKRISEELRNAKTRNSGTFPGDSHAAGRHDCPAPCERCSRPICRFNACSPVRFNSTQPMKNTAFALKDIMRFSQFRIPDNRANEIH